MNPFAYSLGAAIALVVFILWREVTRLAGRCSAPGCKGRGWWRVFLIVRPAKGGKPDPLSKLPTPLRACGACRRAMKKGDPRPVREDRKVIGSKLARLTGEKPDWNRTTNEFEHVVAVKLRGIR